MATKFSDFTAQAATGTTFVVGYDGTTNTQYSQDNLTNFVLDGTLSANRLVNFNSNTLQLGNQGTDGAGVKIFQDGRIEIAKWSGSFKVSGYGTQLRQNFLRLYSNTTLGATITGFATLAASSNWTDGGTGGNGFSINSRLGVIGVHNDNTSYAFRVQNSDNDELMQVRNDGAIAIGKGTAAGDVGAVIIGQDSVANQRGVSIGRSVTSGQEGICIGYEAGLNAATGRNINIGTYAQGSGTASIMLNSSAGFQATNTTPYNFGVYMSSNTTPDFRVIGNEGMIPPSITTTVRNAISSPVTGSTIYNTTDNKLQFYNGTAWTDAAGGDNIYTADGTLSGNRDVDLATNNLSFTNGEVGIGTTTFTNVGTGISGLEISDSTSGSILLRNDADNHTSYWYNHSTGTYFGTKTNDKLNILQNDTVRMNISTDGNLAIGQTTTAASARLHIKGSGATNATTALLVEDASGNDIIKALDDRTVRLGYNANQITTEIPNGGKVRLNNISGDPLFSAGIVSGSTGKINVYGGYYNTFEYAASKGLVFTNEAGYHVAQDASSMLTCVSSTKGFLPPRMTTTQRDAINSGTFTTGLTLYNTTDNKLQFYNGSAWTDAGGGGDSIYTADGTISDLTRTISVPQNGNIYFSPSTAGQAFTYYIGDNYISSLGEIRIPQGGRFKINSFNTELRRNFLKLYGGAGPCLNGTVNGFLTISSFGNADPSATYSINARLGVVGKSATSTTDYAFRVQDSAAADMLTVRDDGAITLGKGATIQSTSAPQYSVVIGYGAKDKASAGNGVEAVSIGRIAVGHQNGVAIGGQAKCLGASATAVGAQAQAKATGVSVGLQAGGPNAGSSAVSIGKFAQAKATGSIAIGTNTGLTGANSIVLNATAGVTSTTTTDTFEVFMSDTSAPDFKIAHDGNSYITGTGNFGFGDGNTSPTATVDIDGTFRLRSATNVNGKVLTADANGNGTWQTASGGSAGQNLLAITSITGSGGSQVSHDIKVYSSTTSNNFAAINFNSDETARYAKIVFTPTSTVAKVVFRALGKDVGGTGEAWLGLHSSSSQTASPAYGWFLVNKDAESNEYEHITAEWLLTGLTANQQITAYVMGISSSSGSTFYARELNTGAWNSTSDTTAFPVTVEAYDVSATITSNPSS